MGEDPWIGKTLGGRYRVTSALGAGGMGAVYRAIQDPLGREVAVKVLGSRMDHDDEARARFEGEARALAKLSHTNVVVLHDFGSTEDGELYLVMESVPGKPLRELMQTHGALAWPRAARLAAQVARGLRAAHAAGVIHADLKPENIVLHRPAGEDEQAKLLDFGLARLAESGDSGVTQAGIIVGTPRYLSPERIKGVRDDPRSDIYALGVMLFEMLCGRTPFEAAAPAMLLVQHMSEQPAAPGAAGALVPEELDRLVLQMLAKAPGDRPPDAGAVVDVLEDLLERESTIAQTATAEGEPVSALGTAEGVELTWPPIAAGAPLGRVTLVFTDIEGSSSFWDAAPAAMRDALAVHDEVMRRTLASRGGYEVKTQGDSFMVTFTSPADAIAWCFDAQEALLTAPWPEALLEVEGCQDVRAADGTLLHRGLRVRMGVFEGEPDARPDPVTGRMDYFGPVVNRAARVEAAAHGGQVLVGGHLAHVVETLFPEGELVALDLGEHRLKGLEGSELLKQVAAGTLRARAFPPPRTETGELERTNLGKDQSTFIGREADLDRVQAAFEAATLVTLLGPGGTGKTRLSRRYGAQRLAELRGGVWFADLTTATTKVGVVTALAEAIGLEQLGGETFDETVALLGQHLAAGGPTLVIFDNFEQIVDEGADAVATWRRLAPDTMFLVTSRIPLQIEGEHTIELAPFDVEVGVQLFRERCARELQDDELDAVREIVTALDGMPLAIELAAARARVLSPRQIVSRLGKRLDFLKESRRDRSSRQTHLRGAIDWSWDLLDETERSLFAQCSVFVGGFTLEAAEEVLLLEDDDADVLDVVQSLKEKSLLRAHPTSGGELRFDMYATIRAYAEEKLAEHGDARAATELRHARHYTERGEDDARAVWGPRAPEGLAGLATERENLLAAARRFEDREPSLTARALVALERLIQWRGPYQGRVDLLWRALAAAERAGVPAIELRVRLSLGRFFALEGDAQRALDLLEPAIAIAHDLDDGDAFVEAAAYSQRAVIRQGQGHAGQSWNDEAEARLLEVGPRPRALYENAMSVRFLGTGSFDDAMRSGRIALGLARQAGDRSLEGRVLGNLGVVSLIVGNLDGAINYYEDALKIMVEVGQRPMEGLLVANLGTVYFTRGELKRAREALERGIAIHREVGNAHLTASDSLHLGAVLFSLGYPEEAERIVREALEFFEHRTGMVRETVTGLTALVFLAAHRGDLAEVRRRREQLEPFRGQLGGLLYFEADVLNLIDSRCLLAEAVALPKGDPERERLTAEALAGFNLARHTKVYFLHGYVFWLERAFEEAGVQVEDVLQAIA